MPDYKNGLIYKLVCNDTYITENYIGSCCDYKQRKGQHKSDCNNINSKKYNQYNYTFIREHGGFENWSMIIIKQFPCNSKRELETEERVQIDLLGGELNTYRPVITEEESKYKEQQFEYRQKHKEKRNEYSKQYYLEHKEERREQKKKDDKQYRENNKEKIKEYKTQKFECECGGKYTHSNKARHLKSKTHINHINNSKDTS